MATVALSGDDTFTLNNRVLRDVADGDWAHLTYPNEIATLKTGKNGNTIYAFNATGKNAELELRIIRGSSDDVFLNGLLAQQQTGFATFPLLIGEFVKKIGNNTNGTVIADTYVLSGGVFMKQVEAKTNVGGDTDQSVSVYKLKFSGAPRSIT